MIFFLSLFIFILKRKGAENKIVLLLLCFTIPPFLFYTLIHFGRAGYILNFLPPLFVFAAIVLDKNLNFKYLKFLLIAAVALNGVYFFRLKTNFTLREIKRSDIFIMNTVNTVKENFNPSKTIILSNLRYRQFVNYLPDYKIIWPVASVPIADGRFFNFIVKCENLKENHNFPGSQ